MAVRFYLCVQRAAMRRGFDTLAASVQEFLKHDPCSGNLFLFVGRDKGRMKILYQERMDFVCGIRDLRNAPLSCQQRGMRETKRPRA